MKSLADKLLLEGYARQAALADLRSREDRVAKQIALLSKSFEAFGSQSPASSSRGAAAAAAAAPGPAAAADHDVADVPRCIEGIKKLQAKNHGGSNQAVLISQLGLAIKPKVCIIAPKSLASAALGPPF